MKKSLDIKKGAEAITDVLRKTGEMGKKASVSIQKSAKELSEKSKNDSYLRRMKKYNPLFPEKYHSEEFNIPNMIVIVDDAVRRGIDVCEGAIGWLSNENGMEVLHLYDEAIEESGIQFVPAPICDAVYYVDRFDRKRFIQTDSIFSKAHEERLAELKHIAYSLGAKSCSIEITETNIQVQSRSKSAEVSTKGGVIKSAEKAEQNMSYKGSTQRSGKVVVEFEGSNDVKCPNLKWFAHDDTIKNLIEMRCSGSNAIKSETLVLEGAASAAMSQKTAYAIDNTISKISVGGKANMEGQALKENQSKLIFSIEF